MNKVKKEIDSTKSKNVRKNNRLNWRVTDDELADLNLVSINDDEPLSMVLRKAAKMYVNMRKSTY